MPLSPRGVGQAPEHWMAGETGDGNEGRGVAADPSPRAARPQGAPEDAPPAAPAGEGTRLTAAQARAVGHPAGPLLVRAGPGSGKTAVLVGRACAVLRGGASPESLWIVTFTVAARQEVRARLLAAAGPAAAGVRCGTFHAYAHGLLRAAGRLPTVLQEPARQGLLRRALAGYAQGRPSAAGRPAPAPEAGALEALSAAVTLAINTGAVRAGGAAVRAVAELAGLPGAGVPAEALADLLAAYGQAKEAEGAVDLDDLLWAALDLLRARPALLAAERASRQHVLVDEFQDVNLPQWELLRLLCPADGDLTVVGDADQAIYGFRGASARWLAAFGEAYPGTRIELTENFRSRPAIVAAANRLIAAGRGRAAFAGRATRAPVAGGVTVTGHPSVALEARAVAAAVAARLASGVPPQTIGVLYRTTTYPVSLLPALSAAGVPMAVAGGAVGPFSHWVAQDLLAYLRLAHDRDDAAALRRVANRPTRYVGTRLLRQAEEAPPSRGPLLDRLVDLPGLPAWQARPLQQWRSALDRVARLPPAPALRALLREVGYGAFLHARAASGADLSEWLAVVDELLAVAAGASDPTSLQTQVAAADQGIVARMGTRGSAVLLSTCHAAKGLEFDTVFLLGCSEGLLPHRSALQHPAGLEEERRLCYVAFTRARDELHVHWVEPGGVERRPGVGRGPGPAGGPSRFLAEAGLLARAVSKPVPKPGRRAARGDAPWRPTERTGPAAEP